MHAHFIALGALSLGIAAGYRPRLCAALFCIGFTYVELLDRTTYLNHYYLTSLVSLLLAILPTRRETVPLWTIWTLRAQVGVVYIFAGIAKINPDWLFHALPMRIWLYQHGDLPLLGSLLQETWMAYVMSWGGALFDLAIAPEWPRRLLPFVIASAAWQSRWNRGRRHGRRDCHAATLLAMTKWGRLSAVAALTLFALIQLALPMRHFAYPGNVRWNEEGYRFSWRVMLSEKVGFVQYRVRDPDTGQSWLVEPHDYLTPLQVERMSFQPDMIQQTARIIAEDFAGRGYPGLVVNADAFVAFNGRPNARLIDPGVDLASVQPGLAPKAWALPYEPDAATAGNQTSSARP